MRDRRESILAMRDALDALNPSLIDRIHACTRSILSTVEARAAEASSASDDSFLRTLDNNGSSTFVLLSSRARFDGRSGKRKYSHRFEEESECRASEVHCTKLNYENAVIERDSSRKSFPLRHTTTSTLTCPRRRCESVDEGDEARIHSAVICGVHPAHRAAPIAHCPSGCTHSCAACRLGAQVFT